MMIAGQRRLERHGTTLAIAGLVVLIGVGLGGLSGVISNVPMSSDFTLPGRRDGQELPRRLAAVDDAIAREDLMLAMREWREAYGAAVGSRRWTALTAVGDAALRIDAIALRRGVDHASFKAEARRAYLNAFFNARATGSADGVQQAADAFAALGDVEMSARLQAVKGHTR